MPGNELKKVQPGQRFKFPASAFNSFVDAANWVKSQQRGNASDPRQHVIQATVVPARNDSGLPVVRFGVLASNGPIVGPGDEDEFARKVTLKGITPTEATSGRFVIALEPIAAGEIGLAVASGVVQVQVKIRSKAHGFATPDPGRTDRLMTDPNGPARILWREAGEVGQVKWAIVRIEGSEYPWPLKWGTVTRVPCHENYIEVYPDDAEHEEDRVKIVLHYPDTDTVPKKQIASSDRMAYWEVDPVVDHLGSGIAVNPDIDGCSFAEDSTLLIDPKVHHINWLNRHGIEDREDFNFSAEESLDCPHQNTTLQAEWRGIDITAYSQSYLGLRILHLPQRWVEVSRADGSVTATIQWKIVGDETWFHTDDMSGSLVISHIGPDAMTASQNVLTGGSFDNSSRNLTLNVTQLQWDATGHERSPVGQSDLVVNIPHTEYVADETWISRVGSQFQHIGPAAAASSVQVLTGGEFDHGTRELTLYTATVSYDAKGHEVSSASASPIVLTIPDSDTVYTGDDYIYIAGTGIVHKNADATRPTWNQWTISGEAHDEQFPDAWVIARDLYDNDQTWQLDADGAGHVKSPPVPKVQHLSFRHNTPQSTVATTTIQGTGGLSGSGFIKVDGCGHVSERSETISISHGSNYGGTIAIVDKWGTTHTLSFSGTGHLTNYTTSA